MVKDLKLICLFVHYNARGKVDQYVFTYLEHLSRTGFEIYFISNSPVKKEYRDRVTSSITNCKIFERENKGADFGAWKWAIEKKIIPGDFDYLLLTNDSIYGPLFPLGPVIESMVAKEDKDFWGLTDNHHAQWHIQSYFFLVTKKVFDSDAFRKIFRQDFSKSHKLEIIRKGEVQLTISLIEAGFKGDVYVPYTKLSPDTEPWAAKNPTHFFWDILIEKFQFPFVKKEIVLSNPELIQSVGNLFPLIRKYSTYPIENIQESIFEYLALADTPGTFSDRVSVICHLYYPGTIYYFLTKLLPLKSSNTQFVFNLSAPLYYNAFFCEMLTHYFPDSFIIFTPNQGRYIGGKLAAFDVLVKSGADSDFTLIIHDKVSPHTPTGQEWRDQLLTNNDPGTVTLIFQKFPQQEKGGVITTEKLIKK